MHVWYVSKYVSPPQGASAGGRGYELMRELASLGHECVIVTSDANHLASVPDIRGRSLTQRRDGLTMVWVRTFKAPLAKSWRRILSWLHFEWALMRLDKDELPRPDVIVVSSLSLLTVITGLVLRRRYSARLVFEVRDIWPLTLVEEGGYHERNPLVRALGVVEREGYRRADEVVGTMPNLAAHVTAVLGRPREVHCIPMGYAPRAVNRVEPLPDGYLAEHLATDRTVICYAGTIGIANALEVFFRTAEVMAADADVQFVVLGDGPLLPDYVRRFGHLTNVTFAPKVSKAAVQQVLATCDILYLSVHESRRYAYGQSLNKVIDYMLAGKPIVASYSGFPSMIDEADCGTYVAAGDVQALARELRRYASMSESERGEIGERGRTWVLKNRSYEGLALDYVAILLPSQPSMLD